jgi:hypothetical protein
MTIITGYYNIVMERTKQVWKDYIFKEYGIKLEVGKMYEHFFAYYLDTANEWYDIIFQPWKLIIRMFNKEVMVPKMSVKMMKIPWHIGKYIDKKIMKVPLIVEEVDEHDSKKIEMSRVGSKPTDTI